MDRHQAKHLAETTTTEEIKEMLNNALNSINDWHVPSAANRGINLSEAMKLFQGVLNVVTGEIEEITKTNMIHCFGDYLPMKLEDVVDYDTEDDLPW